MCLGATQSEIREALAEKGQARSNYARALQAKKGPIPKQEMTQIRKELLDPSTKKLQKSTHEIIKTALSTPMFPKEGKNKDLGKKNELPNARAPSAQTPIVHSSQKAVVIDGSQFPAELDFQVPQKDLKIKGTPVP